MIIFARANVLRGGLFFKTFSFYISVLKYTHSSRTTDENTDGRFSPSLHHLTFWDHVFAIVKSV